jgi:hypothetical protein
MITETIFGLKESNLRKNFSYSTLTKCLRRAATPRRADGTTVPRAADPLPLVAGIRERKNLFNQHTKTIL